jgi:hypothetical protein
MAHRTRIVLAAVAAVAVVLPAAPAAGDVLGVRVVDPARAARQEAQHRWQSVADGSQRVAGVDDFYVAADAASALAARVSMAGWGAADVPVLVEALIGTANPDGGYGLAKPWDAYQDGTVNPATTSYTATTAGHVGPVLLAGYAAGAIPAAPVRRAMDFLLDVPRSHDGRCIPYSGSPADVGKPCIWNVHFGAADWVLRASRLLDYRTDDARRLADVALSWLDILTQNPRTGYWAYSSSGGGPQDLSHQLWTAQAVDSLRGTRDATTAMLSRPLWRVQARRFHDDSVAAAMSSIALFDCHYATDGTVLQYAHPSQARAFVAKSIAAQARLVVGTCFVPTRAFTARKVPVLQGLG